MQEKKTNWVLWGCLGAVGLVVLLVIGGMCGLAVLMRSHLRSLGSTPSLEISPQFRQAAILCNDAGLTKSILLQDARLGEVTDLVWKPLEAGAGPQLGVAGSRGALLADAQGRAQSIISFTGRADRVDFVDVEGDGVCEFMNRGSWAVPASLLDHQGRVVWTYSAGVDDMAAGDLNGDGALEFVVGFNGGGGVHLLNTAGQRQWRQLDGNVWHVEIVDTNGDGQPEIVHSNAGGQMTIRDRQGQVLLRAHPPAYFSSFSLCHWPTAGDPLRALSAEKDKLWVLDFSGTPVAELSAPGIGDLGDAYGTPVRLGPQGKPYFAALINYRVADRAVLCVYDSQGQMVYQEALGQSGTAVGMLPAGHSGEEALLVGGQGVVWQYRVGTPTKP